MLQVHPTEPCFRGFRGVWAVFLFNLDFRAEDGDLIFYLGLCGGMFPTVDVHP